jgi:hypothetical protein
MMSCKHGNWAPCDECDAEDSAAEENRKAGAADERARIASWMDADWPGDAAEERYHRAWIAAKLRLVA